MNLVAIAFLIVGWPAFGPGDLFLAAVMALSICLGSVTAGCLVGVPSRGRNTLLDQ